MRLSKRDYRLLTYFVLLLFLCWGGRFLLLIHPEASFPLSLKWQDDLGYSTYERPAYQDGLILFPANGLVTSHWYGIKAATGQIAWSRPIKRNNFLRCLTAEYLVVSGPGSFATLNPATGEIVWTKESAQQATCSENLVFSRDVPRDSIHAFDLSTGQQLWGATEPLRSFSTIIYNPETNELIAGGEAIVDPQSGRIVRPFGHLSIFPPDEQGRGPMLLLEKGQLFIGATVLDARTGEVIHKEDRYGSRTAPTVTADVVYIPSSYEIVAFDRATYNINWSYLPKHHLVDWIPIIPISPVAILDKVGYVIYSDATLRAFDLETGQEIGYWQPGLTDRLTWPVCVPLPFPLCTGFSGVGMATSEDTLFVSFGNGKLYAFGK